MYSLNIDKYKEEKKKINATNKQLESLNKLPKELTVNALAADAGKFANDKDKDDRFKSWLKNLRNDLYLDETVNVMNDMVSQHNMALNQGAKKLPY